MKRIWYAIEKWQLTTKLLFGFSIGVLTAILIGLYSLTVLNEISKTMEDMYEKDTMGIFYISEANADLIYIGRAVRSLLLSPDDKTRDYYVSLARMRREHLNSSLAQARESIYREHIVAQYDEVMKRLQLAYQYNDRVESLALRSEAGRKEAIAFILSQEFIDTIKAADDELGDLLKLKLEASKMSLEASRQSAESAKSVMSALMIVCIALVMGIGYVVSKAIVNPYERLRVSIQALAEGDVDQIIPNREYKNEIGKLAEAIHFLKDIYSKSKNQHWIKTQVSELSKAIQQADDFRSLAQTVISKVAPAVGAGHGAFYVSDDEAVYHLMASYGFRERKHLSNSYSLGESLVGQCAVEKSMIMLTAPKDYIRINSGLGEGPPACIIVLPIIHSENVLGVLELASFQQFGELEVKFLEEMLPLLGSSMEIIDRNQKTRELLEATKIQAERMEIQAAQLEEQSVEMEAQQAELMETENWYKGIIESAPDGIIVADAQGQIMLSNPAIAHLLGYSSVELAQRRLSDLGCNAFNISNILQSESKENETETWSTVEAVCKDGSKRAVSVIMKKMHGRSNRGDAICVTMRAIQ